MPDECVFLNPFFRIEPPLFGPVLLIASLHFQNQRLSLFWGVFFRMSMFPLFSSTTKPLPYCLAGGSYEKSTCWGVEVLPLLAPLYFFPSHATSVPFLIFVT